MKWYSTPESLIAGEISILAILETVAAITMSALIAYHFSSLKYIAISACIAPWLLLRSEKATILNIRLFEKVNHICKKYYNKALEISSSYVRISIVSFIYFILSITNVTITRIYSIIITLIKNPIYSIKNIPTNWNKVVLSTDILNPPQFFPGIELSEIGSDVKHQLMTWEVIKKTKDILSELKSEKQKAFLSTISTIVIISIIIISFIYRWSIKSTALIWSPLIWILRTPSTGDLIYRLNQINESAIYKIIRYYSALVIIILLFKIRILMALGKFPGAHILNEFLLPHEISIWHITAFINAFLALLLYFTADWFLRKYKHNKPIPESFLEKGIHFLTTIRVPLSLYTIACTLYITVNIGLKMNWPSLGTKIFPWP